ncbi:MarR family winged helix-turn-helix transcriptional regulator [Cohnella zeiphila]|uniref:MarR family transcriptional regulator n=1 Tax=Cohnella zeiphila TaxID=2761120 RepID=A0A7X0SSH7_9BACL|nr:MarR family transcriptional regulator [Cohnella zeiphila]MBB6735289.1 MarR family transcriptional regulator [Cohnella zeiphila]
MSISDVPAGDGEIDVLDALLRTSHYLKREFETRLSSMDIPSFLTGPRLHLLIAVSDSGPMRMSDLAAAMGIKAITVTQFVDALEKERMLERVPDPNDRRATIVRLTEHAPPLVKQARAAAKTVKDALIEPLPQEARDQLLGLLSRLVNFKDVCIFDSKGRHA